MLKTFVPKFTKTIYVGSIIGGSVIGGLFCGGKELDNIDKEDSKTNELYVIDKIKNPLEYSAEFVFRFGRVAWASSSGAALGAFGVAFFPITMPGYYFYKQRKIETSK